MKPTHQLLVLITGIVLLISPSVNAQVNPGTLKQARNLVSEKKFAQAAEIFSQLIKTDSLCYTCYVERGSAYNEIDSLDNAFIDYTKAIELYPDSAEAYHRRGILFYRLRYSEESISDNTKALDLATDDSLRMISFVNRGNAKQQKRDFQGAYEDYYRGYLMDTSSTATLNNMATVLDELGRRDEAISYLKKIISISPEFIGPYVNIGFIYSKVGKYKEALSYFDKALTLEKDEPITLNNRGYVKYQMKDYTGALKDINLSISLYPGNAYAYKNRALVYIAQRDMNKACQDIKTAKEQGFTEMYGNEVEELEKQNCSSK